MTEVAERQQAENVKAFKDGVVSGAPAGTRYNFVEGTRPAGKDDIAHIGVEMHTEHGGLAIDTSKPVGVKTPMGDLSLKEIFAKLAGVAPDSLKHAPPGNVATYYQEIGEHEAPHLGHHPGGLDGGLGNEIAGDKAAYNGNNPEVEEAVRDTRKLSSLIHPDHATSPALPDKPGGVAEDKSTIKMYGAAKEFSRLVADELIRQGKLASADGLEALQQKDPKAVYDSINSLKQNGTFDNIDGSRGEFILYIAEGRWDISTACSGKVALTLPSLEALGGRGGINSFTVASIGPVT